MGPYNIRPIYKVHKKIRKKLLLRLEVGRGTWRPFVWFFLQHQQNAQLQGALFTL